MSLEPARVEELIDHYHQICDDIDALRRKRRAEEFLLLGRRADALRGLVYGGMSKTAVARLVGCSAIHVGRMIAEDMERRATLAMASADVLCFGVGAYERGKRVGAVVDSRVSIDRVADAGNRYGLRLLWGVPAIRSGAAHTVAAYADSRVKPGDKLVEYVFNRHDPDGMTDPGC
jgi:pimeloyl-ACP methyl ester carboxylesterase